MLIYCIKNTVNEKCYIGQTIQNFKKRKTQHFSGLKNDRHGNPYLQNAWNKYDKDDFKWVILEEGFDSLRELNKAEEFWISYLRTTNRKSGYNLDSGGNNKKRSKETLLKMSESQKGKIIPQEMRDYLSVACSGWSHTEEAKEKISKKGSEHPRSIFDEKDILEIREKYATGKFSQPELAKQYDCSNYSISNIVLGKSWKHVDGPIAERNQFNRNRFKSGRKVTTEEKEKKSKLTKNDVLDIRNAYKFDCISQYDLAKGYDVSQGCIHGIVNNKRWTNI